MLESIQNNTFEYEKLSPEEQERRGILGRLTGVIADFKNPTRNGRLYGQKLWDKLFEDPITKEKIENRCMFGEIEHPLTDRSAIDPEKIAVCLAEVPKKDNKGHLIGIFDILNTPCGKILKTLLDYGTTVGVSSRGQGDTFTNYDGVEEVDPETYDCTGWDVVLLPAVKEARMKLVTESVGNKSLKIALAESLNSAKAEDKKIMLEELDALGIKVDTRNSSQEGVDIDATVEHEKADNDGASLVEELQTALLQNQKLQEKVGSLQEKLSVCYAKEYDYKEEIDSYKKTIVKLTESNKTISPLKKRVESLTEELNSVNKTLVDSEHSSKTKDEKTKSLRKECNLLRENLENSNALNASLQEQLQREQKHFNSKIKQLQKEMDALNEQLLSAKKDSTVKNKQYSDKLEKANNLVEKYKKIAKISVDKYVESQALKLGVNSKDIKMRLGESYTFDDIDRICEDIQSYRIGMSSLPFRSGFNAGTKMKVTESLDTSVPLNEDDRIDSTLLSLVGLK